MGKRGIIFGKFIYLINFSLPWRFFCCFFVLKLIVPVLEIKIKMEKKFAAFQMSFFSFLAELFLTKIFEKFSWERKGSLKSFAYRVINLIFFCLGKLPWVQSIFFALQRFFEMENLFSLHSSIRRDFWEFFLGWRRPLQNNWNIGIIGIEIKLNFSKVKV